MKESSEYDKYHNKGCFYLLFLHHKFKQFQNQDNMETKAKLNTQIREFFIILVVLIGLFLAKEEATKQKTMKILRSKGSKQPNSRHLLLFQKL